MLRREGVLKETPSRALPVESSEGPLPASADVVIIGGGIQGVCSAFFLAERGLNVVICEKGEVAGEQSGRAYSQIIAWEMELFGLPLIVHSKELWSGMNKRIGADTSWQIRPRVQTYVNEEDLAAAQEWAKKAKASVPNPDQLKVRFIEGAKLQEHIPGARTAWKMGGLEENAASVDPEIGTPMIARYLQTKGVKIFTRCAVRGLETRGGRVSGVVTEKGAIRASTVVLAAGSWSRLFLGNYGLKLRTLPLYLSQQRLTGVEGAPKGNGSIGNGVYYRLQADGTYANAPRIFTAPFVRESLTIGWEFLPTLLKGGMHGLPLYFSLNSEFVESFETPHHWKLDEVTPFEKLRVATPTPNHEFCDLALARLRSEFPAFEKSTVIERWGGCVDLAADVAPVISPVDQYPGLFINTAHSFGMTQGPAVGEMIADMVTGAELKVDPKPYRFSRFAA
jgi:glycine/D-amino acid oxidase-like deaminating enzyme